MTLAVGDASPASPSDSNSSRECEWRDRAPGVEARLAGLARSPAALRRALARIAGRLVATRAWERLGFARLRDYAVERVGLSAREIQDLARVDAALAELPRVESALVSGHSGQIPWTKARLLCRVATRDDESLWLAAAERLPAEALAREVRAVDQRAALAGSEAGGAATDADGEERRVTVRLRCSGPVRAKWFSARQLARRAAGEALLPWACAEAIAAEVLSAMPLEGEGEACCRAVRPGGAARGDECGSVAPELRAPPPPVQAASSRFLDALVEDLDIADAFEIDRRLRRAVRLEQQIEARMGPLLLAVAAERLHWELGFRSFDAYARERLGMAASKARALLRLERACLVSPALREAWRAGQLSWSQAHALVPLLLLEHSLPWHAAWVARARRVSVRRLEDDVDHAIATGELDPGALPVVSSFPAGLQIGADPMVSEGAHEGRVRLFFNAPRDVARWGTFVQDGRPLALACWARIASRISQEDFAMSAPKDTTVTVIPGLRYQDAPKAIDWLCRAFGFEKKLVVPGEGGSIAHAQLTYGNGMIMLGSAGKHGGGYDELVKTPAEVGGVGTQGAYVVVEDADAHLAQARAAGAEIVMDIEDKEYGGRGYSCRDLEGHLWSFGTLDPWEG